MAGVSGSYGAVTNLTASDTHGPFDDPVLCIGIGSNF